MCAAAVSRMRRHGFYEKRRYRTIIHIRSKCEVSSLPPLNLCLLYMGVAKEFHRPPSHRYRFALFLLIQQQVAALNKHTENL